MASTEDEAPPATIAVRVALLNLIEVLSRDAPDLLPELIAAMDRSARSYTEGGDINDAREIERLARFITDSSGRQD